MKSMTTSQLGKSASRPKLEPGLVEHEGDVTK